MVENIQSHKSGANNKLYNIAMNGFPLSSFMFIWTCSVYFYVAQCTSETSIYVSVYNSDPGTKCEISGVMWHVPSKSKIQLVSCEMSPKYFLGIYLSRDIRAIGAYIFWDSFCYVLFSDFLSTFVDLYAQCFGLSIFQRTFSEFSGFGNMLYSDPLIRTWNMYLDLYCCIHYLYSWLN